MSTKNGLFSLHSFSLTGLTNCEFLWDNFRSRNRRNGLSYDRKKAVDRSQSRMEIEHNLIFCYCLRSQKTVSMWSQKFGG